MPRALGRTAGVTQIRRWGGRGSLLAGAACAGMLAGTPAAAYQTTVDGWEVNLDTTLTSGVALRTSDVNDRFVGIANGGQFPLPNADNGTLDYRPGGPVAAQQRITTELQIKHDDVGLFVRATGFYDPIIDSDVQGARFPLSRAAVRDIGADLRLLDAYVFASPEIFGHRFDLRVGNQALNWGESTFIQFGINSINPLDVTALRTPGSELRNGFLPIPAVDVKTEIVQDLNLEAFWQPVWTRDRLEPVGSFFFNNDTLVDGGKYGLLYSYLPDAYKSIYAVSFARNLAFGGAYPRILDRHPTGLDEFGVALRKSLPQLNDAEIGLYFENYDSRLPFGSYHTGSPNISTGLFGLPGTQVLPNPVSTFLTGGYAEKTYNSTAGFFADYPKSIHLIGLSFNFNAPGGVAIQGEYSNRLNQPIQLAASDLALATAAPAICELAGSSLGTAFVKTACAAAQSDPTIIASGGIHPFNTPIDGWKRYPVSQFQVTGTKLWNSIPQYGISSVALVGEIGLDYVHDFPSQRGIFNATYTTDTNSAFNTVATVNNNSPVSRKGLVTQTSAAYTVQLIIDMPNVLPYGIDMKPQIALQHDFMGTSPYGVNVFQENTAAASVGVTFNYLQAWSLNVQYTNHFPVFDGGKYYGLIDRDFFSAALSYEF